MNAHSNRKWPLNLPGRGGLTIVFAFALLFSVSHGLAGDAPKRLTVVSDINYPPYMFVGEGGELQGILKEKWDLWSRKTGVPVEVKGMVWATAQQDVLSGAADVIEALAYSDERARSYEYSQPYAPVEARVFFHNSVGGISDVPSMRGFEIGAKEGSACAGWLAARGIATIRNYSNSDAVVSAARAGDIRVFCMDSPVARYFLHRTGIAPQFRESPPLYSGNFHWAVRRGQTELRDFIQQGFDRIPADELSGIEARWLGSPVSVLLSPQYRVYLASVLAALAAAGALMFMWNRTLRRQVVAKTAEWHRAYAESNAWQKRYESVLAASQILMYEVSPGSRTFIWGGNVKELLGIAPESIPDVPAWIERVHPDDRHMLAGLRERFASGEINSVEREYRVRRDDGSYIAVGATAYGIVDDERTDRQARHSVAPPDIRVIGFIRDISERRRAEEEKGALEERLKQAEKMEAIGRFADGIAHDFNNILGAILGYGELAKGKASAGSDIRRYLDTIHSAGERGRSLVAQILTFSRARPAEKRPILVAELVEEVVVQVEGSLPQGISIKIVNDHPGAVVLGEATQLHQLVMNLCTNAVQAMPAGGEVVLGVRAIRNGVEHALHIGTLRRANYVGIEVRDAGEGMNEATAARIFEPFFTTKPVGQGTGLGLSLVQSIALEHGGALDLEFALGRGTRISIYLPEAAGGWESPGLADSALPRGRGETVMVIDDEPAMAGLAQEMLAELGYEAVAFTSSVDALGAYQKDPARFDAILSDEVMPQLTGTQLSARLRQAHATLPILIISGYGGPGFEIRAKEAGVDRLLRKPYRRRELAQALASLLSSRA
jgi:PAS domain S-box-containing protein